ncbi:Aste57867_15786 [Aphanomyces stellatus]|uniref:Aste57867_15786 protein n=1 Tax=Aphanomyces stellatus TaxID=120398 RepID=A0A485L584_9STRA|nr:hypothetical protein As57867_015730 [Aphanomyces stellatus]VFT92574.1 Aste57867_15786 [Aphanomyces stellatus]
MVLLSFRKREANASRRFKILEGDLVAPFCTFRQCTPYVHSTQPQEPHHVHFFETLVMLVHDAAAIDYFALHKRKMKDVDVDMLDYAYVASCADVDLLKNILVVLQSGKEGKYPQLEAAVEGRLLDVLPPAEKQRILCMKATPSAGDIGAEAQALAAWEAEMASKSAELDAARGVAGVRSRPPPRGVATASSSFPIIRPTTAPVVSTSKPKKQAIPAYDWRAWEKFDVDAAERAVDQEEQQRRAAAVRQQEDDARRRKQRLHESAMMPASVDVAAMSAAERAVCAAHEKQKGNESFRAGDNDDAVLCYSRSLVFDPASAVVYANRALVHLKLKNLSAAEADCTMAIEGDATYGKAWSRRGMTRFRRGNYAGAVADFERALALEPANREIPKLLQRTKEKWADVDGTSVAAAAAAPPPAKPFQRFEIIEDSDDDDDDDDDAPPVMTQPGETKPFQRFEILDESDDE